ncbi:ELWxxDGT repeat protein [Dyadobacter sp. NIV53]|uniref:ELWxxDGT repeat protein n=1 Tax=Dyadobacter sp. NIV53 TaxID=2861765 RepID=UPI001C87A419|nr:ELWxxDGT repeat protein [Dyadobacter sp. NIV53]
MKKLLFFLAVLVMPCILTAQQIELVKDINVSPTGFGLSFRGQAVANNMLFMIAGDNTNGFQLWRSDGTNEGTIRLTDNYQLNNTSDPSYLTSAGTYVCFRMVVDNENWLFRSDGTKEGTYPIHKIAFSSSEYWWDMANVNGTIFFSSAGEPNGRQLWKTDGTNEGTVLVKDFGVSTTGESGPLEFFDFNGKLSFVIRDEENYSPAVLWESDGTEAGTVPGPALTRGILQRAVLGGYMYFPEEGSLYRTDGKTITIVKDGFYWLRGPFVVGQTIYFSANHEESGEELWKSDGTAEGTVLVKDIYQGTKDSDPTAFANVAGTLFFKAQSPSGWRLWKSDGSEPGTVQVSDIEVSRYTFAGQNDLVAVGNQIVFPAGPESNELWKSDGTEGGTQRLAPFRVEVEGRVGNEVFFIGNGSNGENLYKTDMTISGTKAITSKSSTASSSPQNLTDVNGTAYFITVSKDSEYDLWKSDGTEGGTFKLQGPSISYEYSPPEYLTNVNATLFYVKNSDELWKSNGTEKGTEQIPIEEEPNYGGAISELIPVNETLFFQRSNNIWKTDGTKAGTVPIAGKGSAGFGAVAGLTNANGTLFFGSNDFTSETMDLWKSNGTPEGTTVIGTFEQNYQFSPVAFKGELYFGARDGVNSVELWKSNGTVEGTKVVRDVTSSRGDFLYKSETIAASGNFLYYITNDTTGYPLVRTDGTAGGTSLIKNLFPGGHLERCRLYAAMGLVYFTLYNPDTNQDLLWRTDGTTGGTFQLASFDAYVPKDSYEEQTTIRIKEELNGKLLFVPYNKETGDQLWVTDGTPVGTKMLTTMGRTPARFTLSPSVKFGNLFYFSMYDQDNGVELWQSDGTEAGTHIITDFNPDGNTAFYEMAVIGNKLFLAADNGKSGNELYKYVPSAKEDVVISPVADAYVRNVPLETNNFGTEPELGIKASSLPSYQRKTYLKFPLSSVNDFTSAKLRIYGHNLENNINVILAATGVENDSWTETGINWLNAPSGNGPVLDSVTVNSQLSYYELDVTDFVKTQLDGDKTASFLLTNPTSQNIRLFFNSRENAANPPQLVLVNQTGQAARIAAMTTPVRKRSNNISVIYPNPVRDRFSIQVSDLHKGPTQLMLTNMSGKTLFINPALLKNNATSVEADISSLKLPAGKYLVQVKSVSKLEVINVMVSN